MITFTKVALPYGWLGNMSPFPVMHEGVRWYTTEHLFQALRFPKESSVRDLIGKSKSPMSAKMTAKKYSSEMVVVPRTSADLDNMRLCLMLKAASYPKVLADLLATGDEKLVEDVSARPSAASLYWGMAKRLDGS